MNKVKNILAIMFLPTFVLADDLYTSDIVGGCGDAYYYKAILEPISYTCSNGQYLPAGAISCQSCPNTHTCNGGTFSFDANHTQGLEYGDILVTDAIGSCSNKFTQNYGAVFDPITYVCPAGYYLPAGTDWVNDFEGCRICPLNHYCTGGTYSFKETDDQGIVACPDAHPYAPAGMWLASQCGRKLHIGNDILYMHQSPSNPTLHRLFVQYGNTVYSANAVPKQIGVNGPKMSADAGNELHVTIGDYEYVVCDDSIPECRND